MELRYGMPGIEWDNMTRIWTVGGSKKRMGKIAIVTDSNRGITQAEAKNLGIYVIPMPFYINGELFYEDIDLTQEEFYRQLEGGAEISTSMPVVGDVTDLWDRLLKEYDEIVHIPMSSGLSSTCSTARMLSQADEYAGRVFVVDNKRISVTQKQAALDARTMVSLGWSAARIRDKLLETMLDASIYITLDTLSYLKKGGRVTPAVAAIGSLLRIKPVLQIQGDKLDAYANARTKKAARTMMLDAIRKDNRERFGADERAEGIQIAMAYSGAYSEEVQAWRQELEAAFPAHKGEILVDPLSLSVSCHIGPGAIGYGCMKKLKF